MRCSSLRSTFLSAPDLSHAARIFLTLPRWAPVSAPFHSSYKYATSPDIGWETGSARRRGFTLARFLIDLVPPMDHCVYVVW